MIPPHTALRPRLGTALVLALALLVAPIAARAQAPGGGAPAAAAPASTLSGTVVDTAGRAAGGLELTLHRVSGQGGAPVAHDTSDARGRFRLVVPAETEPDAIYFVATRYNGDLYVGPTFKAPYPEGQSYGLTVGANPVRAEALPAQPGSPAPMQVPEAARAEDRRAGRLFFAVLLALAALAAAGVAGVRWRGERAERRRRGFVLELAALDERYADRLAALSAEEAASYRRRRAALAARAAGI
ncbi:MAG: hypothetical protein IRZ00_03795 [Gemmatimonadetes bacterium]|nr:hypothetical protein [Gemmatimonadota bacterium]